MSLLDLLLPSRRRHREASTGEMAEIMRLPEPPADPSDSSAWDEYCGEVREFYFPSGEMVQPSPDPMDQLDQCLLGIALQAMSEPCLGNALGPADWEYRFVWLRTRHHPVAISVEHRGRQASLRVKELDGQGGRELGGLCRADEQTINIAKLGAMARLVVEADFWRLPPVSERMGLDGAMWYLEGARADKHKLVCRWSPEPNGSDERFRALCLELLDLGDIGPHAEPVY